MDLHDFIGRIDAASNSEELKNILQRKIAMFGFSSFAFLDISNPANEDPILIATNGKAWERTYRSENFIEFDPCIWRARRQNIPFAWHEISSDILVNRSGAKKTMDAAKDHGFGNGMVVPLHYVDRLGRPFTAVCTLFWTENAKEFMRLWDLRRNELYVALIYWTQKIVDIVSMERRRKARFLDGGEGNDAPINLSDREKDVLNWASRGKTTPETATILGISAETVTTHVKNAISKIGAANKVHAVTKAIYLGLIDP